ncbi:nucleoside/nucleotide kinase family protein [Aureimonas pseudogalii]|uniref:Pantothenate kinase n=1 Tax=Aureimonas pseudogalii TaxID=1744844 RepID=A0A7W6H6T5_9HYPH|nr:nucleoside/nucleotide kinase family protein [Aureimonas pseudogalii]MBB3999618.1 pantothenate kinase [Aureimonas pseudogalii]
MTESLTLAALADALLTEEGATRRIVAIAGSPGSGKSTAAESLKARLNARRPGVADILPMDGYHFDDAVLNARGDRPRKGAPHTFDLDGFRAMLERLRLDTGRDVAVPVFDRSVEIARAGGRIIEATTRIILAEGNYLLLDAPGWRDLAPLFDLTVMVEAREELLIERLTERWLSFGYEPEALIEKLEGNDLPNMRLVLKNSRPADVALRSDGGR